MEDPRSSMNEKELLLELIRTEERAAGLRRLIALGVLVLALVFFAALAICVPRLLSTLSQADAALRETELAMTQLEDSAAKLNALLELNGSGLTETVEHLRSVDFASLNESIETLAEILAPLARLFGKD